MKFTPEVIAALAVLREHADNDFERHRIDVLERDLTAPPQVEVIDEKTQKFNGVIFKENSGKHFISDGGLHRVVWAYYHGEIPYGHQIHHKDHNPANNDVSNLQALTISEHIRCHSHLPVEKICPNCNKRFTVPYSRRNHVYCSRSCYWAHMSRHVIEKVCPVCGKKFAVSYSRKEQTYCSNQCKGVHQKSREERTCIVCGKKFFVRRSVPTLCCSISCGNKLAWQTKRVKHAEKQAPNK